MSFRVRVSKYRHVFCEAPRRDQCYEGLRITHSAHDSALCAVNPALLAVVVETAGAGGFVVLPLEKKGRVDPLIPKISGHAGQLMDIKWNPFHDQIIASAAEDGLIKIWQVPAKGPDDTVTEARVTLKAHTRKLSYIEWHPTAADVMLSASFDHKCLVWDVEAALPLCETRCHTDNIYSISWNRDGTLFSATSKDKRVRIIDPRTGVCVADTAGHDGPKASKACFLTDTDNNKLCCTGFGRQSDRAVIIWDVRRFDSPLYREHIDSSSGVVMPHYDPDNRVLFLAGKGDGNIRYFEVNNSEPYCSYLDQFLSSQPQRGLGVMPKRGLDPSKNEIMRFYKVMSTSPMVQPLSMIVPRRSELFQSDLYPPCAAAVPALSVSQWRAGYNSQPITIDYKDGTLIRPQPSVPSRAVVLSDMTKSPNRNSQDGSARNQKDKSSDQSTSSPKQSAQPEVTSEALPASIRNIRMLSGADDSSQVEERKRKNRFSSLRASEDDWQAAKPRADELFRADSDYENFPPNERNKPEVDVNNTRETNSSNGTSGRLESGFEKTGRSETTDSGSAVKSGRRERLLQHRQASLEKQLSREKVELQKTDIQTADKRTSNVTSRHSLHLSPVQQQAPNQLASTQHSDSLEDVRMRSQTSIKLARSQSPPSVSEQRQFKRMSWNPQSTTTCTPIDQSNTSIHNSSQSSASFQSSGQSNAGLQSPNLLSPPGQSTATLNLSNQSNSSSSSNQPISINTHSTTNGRHSVIRESDEATIGPSADTEQLRVALLRHQKQLRSLREQLVLKDKRIRQLEDEVEKKDKLLAEYQLGDN